MAQKLILPINNAKLTASWKTAEYRKRFTFQHYGIDLVSTAGNKTVYASGNGEVIAAGHDNVVGNVVIVKYHDALHSSGRSWDLIVRYFHFASLRVVKGVKVTKDTVLGLYGNTGMVSTGAHLHLEVDTDCVYPIYSPSVKSSSLLKGTALGANDRTMTNPLEWLHCKTTAQDFQTYTTTNDDFIREEDKKIKKY